jgi:probable HAF family extracellular repeat protein
MGKFQGAIRGAFAACALAAAAQVAAAPTYRLTDLGTLGGSNSFSGGLNAAGHMTGMSELTDGTTRAFVWNGSTMLDLGSVAGRARGYGSAINASGQVAGTTFNDAWSEQVGFVYKGGLLQPLAPLPGHQHTYAQGINDSGIVTGLSLSDFWLDTKAFVYDGVTMTVLPTLGGVYGEGADINNQGHVTGLSSVVNGETHAFLWDGDKITDLGTLGGVYAVGVALNEQDMVAGFSHLASDDPSNPWIGGGRHAFLHDGTTMHDLGTLAGNTSLAWGINADGLVVGQSTHAGSTNDHDTHAFLYDGSLHDLNDLLDASGKGWELSFAGDINASGQIAATGWFNGVQHAVLLTPNVAAVPEPETYALMLGGLGLLAAVARRRRNR